MAVQTPVQIKKPVEQPQLISGEVLFQMGDTARVELVQGEIIRMSPTGYKHGKIENVVARLIDTFVTERNLGMVMVGEVGIYTRRDPDTVRGMDVAYISHERLAQVKSQSFLDVAPELVVEVLSPGDSWQGVMDKLEEYFDIGVSIVWIVDPNKQVVYVYLSLTDVARYEVGETLTGEDVLQEFHVEVGALFGIE